MSVLYAPGIHINLIVSLIKWRAYERTDVPTIYLCRISQSAIQFWQRVSLPSQKTVAFGEKWPQTKAAFCSLYGTSFCMWKLIFPHFFIDWHNFSFTDSAVHHILLKENPSNKVSAPKPIIIYHLKVTKLPVTISKLDRPINALY